MDTIDVNKLTRNPDILKTKFKKIENTTMVLDDIMVVFPESMYIRSNFVEMKKEIDLMCIFAVIDSKNNYAVMTAPIKQKFRPDVISKVNIDGVVHVCLKFMKNSIFFKQNSAIKTQSNLYDIFNNFYMQGRVPWYLKYNDIPEILKGTTKYCGSSIGNNSFIIELVTAIISNAKGSNEPYRHLINSLKDIDKYAIDYIGLEKALGLNTTSARLIGGYMEDNFINAIVDPSTDTTPIEKILTK